MLSFPQQIELINLKERIVSDPILKKKLVSLLGHNKGWRELSEELKYDYTIVRNLKDMAACEFSYDTRSFTAMRAMVFQDEKEFLLRHTTRKHLIILNSPNAVVKLSLCSRKPLKIITARKSRYITYMSNLNSPNETILVTHDTGVPIYIYGPVESLSCTEQRLVECHLLNCPSLSRIDISNNQLKCLKVYNLLPKLTFVDLRLNNVAEDSLIELLRNVNRHENYSLFESNPTILSSSAISNELCWQAKQIGWVIKMDSLSLLPKFQTN